MKKIVLLTLLSAALVLGLVSCGGESSDDGPAGFNAVGTWKCIYSTWSGWATNPFDERFIYKSDMTYEMTFNGKVTEAGTWEYTDTGLREFARGGASSKEYDPATKELVDKFTDDTRRYKKQ